MSQSHEPAEFSGRRQLLQLRLLHEIGLALNESLDPPRPSSQPGTAVTETRNAALPQAFSLAQNYPNPFNSSTSIHFSLPQAGEVDLAIHNSAGQRVAVLVQGMREAGTYSLTWDGRDDTGRVLASGVYLCRPRAGEQEDRRKMLVLR